MEKTLIAILMVVFFRYFAWTIKIVGVVIWYLVMGIVMGMWRIVRHPILQIERFQEFFRRDRKKASNKVVVQEVTTSPTIKSVIRERFKKNFRRNLGVTLVVAFVLVGIHRIDFFMDMEDASMDFITKYWPMKPSSDNTYFVFIDIDDKTFEKWGNPLLVPRDHLKSLLEKSINARPKLIVLDTRFTVKTPVKDVEDLGKEEQCQKLKLHKNDCALYIYLENQAKCEGKVCPPPIILTRNFDPSSEQTGAVYYYLPKLRPTFLDDAIKTDSAFVRWVSVRFPSSSGGKVRRWRWLWQPVCNGDDQNPANVIPSVQLLVASFVKNGNFDLLTESNKTTLDTFKDYMTCNKGDENNVDLSKMWFTSLPEVQVSNGLRILLEKSVSQRIIYDKEMSWPPKEKRCDNNDQTKVLSVCSAWDFESSEVTSEFIKGKVVIIGGSGKYGEISDMHYTPVGQMPGGVLLIHAINSLVRYGQVGVLSWPNELLLYSLVCLFMVVVFTSFSDSYDGMTLSAILSMVILIPVTGWLYQEYGSWLGFGVTLMIIYYSHHLIEISGHKSKE
ncbi:MAG: hypothetical protein BWK78_02445 [Thiotrichaceae bacterium IS1]|nr:MAG: hypothetical protein BWK78_02445 [Thiotrichaceae bacterium IS1]